MRIKTDFGTLVVPDGTSQADIEAAVRDLAGRAGAPPATVEAPIPRERPADLVPPRLGPRDEFNKTAFGRAGRAAINIGGWADEADAAIAGGAAFWRNIPDGLDAAKRAREDAYDKELATARQNAKEFEEGHPVLAPVLGAAGSFAMLPARAVAATQAAMGMGKLMLRGTAAGVAGGAISGAGNAEGDLGDRAIGAGVGALVGGGTGGLLPPGLLSAKALLSRVGNLFGFRKAEELAADKVVRAFERDGVSVDDLMARNAALAKLNAKPETPMELGGENVMGLARSAAQTPGPTRQEAVSFFRDRAEGQGDRIMSDVARTLSPNDGFHVSADDILARRSTDAAPLYEAAYSAVPAVWNDKLADLMRRPSLAEAWQKAQRIAADEGHVLPKVFTTDADGTITGITSAPDMRAIDYIKRGLDDVVQGAKNSLTGKIETDGARAVNKLRADFLEEVDTINPAYAQARAAFSGPTRSLEALQDGRRFLTEDAAVTAKALAALPDGDKEFFRAGVAQGVRDIVENTPDGANAVRRFFGSDAKRAKLRAVFASDEAFEAFRRDMQRETRMVETAGMVNPRAGSQTALRLIDQADAAAPFPDRVVDEAVRSGSLAKGVVDAAGDVWRKARGDGPEVMDQVGRMMFVADPEARRAILEALQRRQTIGRLQPARYAMPADPLGFAAGVTAGDLVAPTR